MALSLSQEQFDQLCSDYAGQDFGFEVFTSIRDLLIYVLHTYDADCLELDAALLHLYDQKKDLTMLALEDPSVQIVMVDQKPMYIYQTYSFDLFEVLRERWISAKLHPEHFFLRSLKCT